MFGFQKVGGLNAEGIKMYNELRSIPLNSVQTPFGPNTVEALKAMPVGETKDMITGLTMGDLELLHYIGQLSDSTAKAFEAVAHTCMQTKFLAIVGIIGVAGLAYWSYKKIESLENEIKMQKSTSEVILDYLREGKEST